MPSRQPKNKRTAGKRLNDIQNIIRIQKDNIQVDFNTNVKNKIHAKNETDPILLLQSQCYTQISLNYRDEKYEQSQPWIDLYNALNECKVLIDTNNDKALLKEIYSFALLVHNSPLIALELDNPGKVLLDNLLTKVTQFNQSTQIIENLDDLSDGEVSQQITNILNDGKAREKKQGEALQALFDEHNISTYNTSQSSEEKLRKPLQKAQTNNLNVSDDDRISLNSSSTYTDEEERNAEEFQSNGNNLRRNSYESNTEQDGDSNYSQDEETSSISSNESLQDNPLNNKQVNTINTARQNLGTFESTKNAGNNQTQNQTQNTIPQSERLLTRVVGEMFKIFSPSNSNNNDKIKNALKDNNIIAKEEQIQEFYHKFGLDVNTLNGFHSNLSFLKAEVLKPNSVVEDCANKFYAHYVLQSALSDYTKTLDRILTNQNIATLPNEDKALLNKLPCEAIINNNTISSCQNLITEFQNRSNVLNNNPSMINEDDNRFTTKPKTNLKTNNNSQSSNNTNINYMANEPYNRNKSIKDIKNKVNNFYGQIDTIIYGTYDENECDDIKLHRKSINNAIISLKDAKKDDEYVKNTIQKIESDIEKIKQNEKYKNTIGLLKDAMAMQKALEEKKEELSQHTGTFFNKNNIEKDIKKDVKKIGKMIDELKDGISNLIFMDKFITLETKKNTQQKFTQLKNLLDEIRSDLTANDIEVNIPEQDFSESFKNNSQNSQENSGTIMVTPKNIDEPRLNQNTVHQTLSTFAEQVRKELSDASIQAQVIEIEQENAVQIKTSKADDFFRAAKLMAEKHGIENVDLKPESLNTALQDYCNAKEKDKEKFKEAFIKNASTYFGSSSQLDTNNLKGSDEQQLGQQEEPTKVKIQNGQIVQGSNKEDPNKEDPNKKDPNKKTPSSRQIGR